jgi:hypothetical protein
MSYKLSSPYANVWVAHGMTTRTVELNSAVL